MTRPILKREFWSALIIFTVFSKWISYKVFHCFAWDWWMSGLQLLLSLTEYYLTYSVFTFWNFIEWNDLLTFTAIHQPPPLPTMSQSSESFLKWLIVQRGDFGRFGYLFLDLLKHKQSSHHWKYVIISCHFTGWKRLGSISWYSAVLFIMVTPFSSKGWYCW